MEHAKAERVVNELPVCRPAKKARRGTGERNEGIPRVIMDGRAESADAVGVSCASCHSCHGPDPFAGGPAAASRVKRPQRAN